MKTPTKREKKLSVEKWQYFYDHPSCMTNADLPIYLHVELRDLLGDCPLCELYLSYVCGDCPIKKADKPCNDLGSYRQKWHNAMTDTTRKKHAGRILKIIEAWKV